jgi:hypothetical protein
MPCILSTQVADFYQLRAFVTLKDFCHMHLQFLWLPILPTCYVALQLFFSGIVLPFSGERGEPFTAQVILSEIIASSFHG